MDMKYLEIDAIKYLWAKIYKMLLIEIVEGLNELSCYYELKEYSVKMEDFPKLSHIFCTIQIKFSPECVCVCLCIFICVCFIEIDKLSLKFI